VRAVSRGTVATAALVALLVVDVVLVAFALRPSDAPDAGSVQVTLDEPTVEPSDPESPLATPTESTPEPPPSAVPLGRLIDASSATEAWRLTKGACPDGGGSVQRTSDGGATWDDVDTGAEAFVRLRARGPADAFVVAVTGEGCEPAFLATSDGETWGELPGSLDDAWYIEPADATAVHSPAGAMAGPCEGPVVDLAGVTSTRAGALCDDGRVFTTDDGAASWAVRVAVPGAVALTDAGDGYLVGVLAAAGCPGVQVVAAGEGTAEALGCSSAAAEPGSVDVAAVGESVWVWAGDAVQVSTDGGRTWP